MSEATNKKFNWRDPGFLGEMFRKVRLAFYLLKDPDVPIYLKAIPFTAVAYWLFPFEGVVNPFLLTPVDDIALLAVCITTFLQLAPQHVVEKYEAKMAGRPISAEGTTQANVVDGEWEMLEEGGNAIDPLDEIIILNPDKVNGYQ